MAAPDRRPVTLKSRAAYLKQHRDKFTPERLLQLTEQLNSDRAGAALMKNNAEHGI